MKTAIGIIGLGVMGTSISRNLARNGFSLSLYNRFVKGVEEDVAQKKINQYEELESALPFEDLKLFADSLTSPKKILLNLTAGAAVDHIIDQLLPFLTPGDLIIDGGNSHFTDTENRLNRLQSKQIFFMGLGISGGEAGALHGPSLMAGGSEDAYALSKNFLKEMAATTAEGEKACNYVGSGGAGHFVKMVHNAIEYAEMQIIAELFEVMHKGMQMGYAEIAAVFEQWNKNEFDAYLLDITIKILKTKDEKGYVLDRILDKASYNQTGSWTLIAGIKDFHSCSMVAAALFSRFNSNRSKAFKGLSITQQEDVPLKLEVDQLRAVFRFTRTVNHYQHFRLVEEMSEKAGWNIDLQKLCSLWSAGCIIKSKLLVQLSPFLENHLSPFFDPQYLNQLNSDRSSVATFIAETANTEIPLPCISAAHTYYKQMIQRKSSANIIQAQRDFFGTHGFQIIGGNPGDLHHYPWER
ncbi:MAG: 6-phosphogluconate dehydrogenase, decarboxylating [Flavobacteriaceae bacterium]|nr:MAG: 6-phosphogluconate dehydrogenase, decarboxylating [Flavobacteriaceae bacterium]